MNLNEAEKEFIKAIKNTREYIQLKQAKSIIDKDKNLKKKVSEFQQKQIQVYSSNRNSKDMNKQMEELQKTFINISKIPEINDFFKASKTFNDMMLNNYKIINNSIDSDLNSK